MPIKVACQCGAAFAAKDELAGRTVACPKCKQPLKIPALQAAVAPQAAPVSHANAELFDDLGLRARSTTEARCPSCAADLPPNAILCVKCGYNLKLGKKMQTMNMAADGSAPLALGHAGHGGQVTAMIMAKAAQNAEDDVLQEKKKTTEGMPIWILVVGVTACILFGVVMTLIPQSTALIGTGVILIVVNVVLMLFANISIYVLAFLKNPLFGAMILIGDVLLLGIAVAIVLYIDEDTVPRSVRNFSLLLVGACGMGYAYTDEKCAQFLFYRWVSVIMGIVGLVLLVIGLIVAAFNSDNASVPMRKQSPGAIACSASEPRLSSQINGLLKLG